MTGWPSPSWRSWTPKAALDFFHSQSFTGVCQENGELLGLYILHPNNLGRCGHICNASYAVASRARGRGVGEALVLHCLKTAKELGFRIMQFNAVVSNNTTALRLYAKTGLHPIGSDPRRIPYEGRKLSGHHTPLQRTVGGSGLNGRCDMGKTLKFLATVLICAMLLPGLTAFAAQEEESGEEKVKLSSGVDEDSILDDTVLTSKVENFLAEWEIDPEQISVGYCYTATGGQLVLQRGGMVLPRKHV